MSTLRIVTDSSARFASFQRRNLANVTFAPASVWCGQQQFVDDPDLNFAAIQPLFGQPGMVPVVIPPSVEAMSEVYRRLLRDTDKILSIHTSARMSAGYSNALSASQQFLGRSDIQVIDSETATAGLGMLVQAAGDAAARGATFDEVVKTVRGMVPRLYMVLFLDDLGYLERNGLVSRSQAILGNMLGVIPFLTMEDGKFIPMEKVRSRPRALEKLTEFVSEFSDVEQMIVMEGSQQPNEDARAIHERLQMLHPSTPIDFVCYGPTMAAWIGAWALGVVVLESAEDGT
jgi:DegV family protein with EDD domain